MNASRGDAFVDAGYAGVQEIELVKSRLAESGVDHELRQLVRGHEPADEVVDLAEELGAERSSSACATARRSASSCSAAPRSGS